MILGKKIGQGDIAGAIPEAPAAWGYQSHCLTSSGVSPWVFTAPERGWYRFYLIGPGGAGGTMPNTISAGDDYTSFCGAGGGGGGGGYAVHDVYLKSGESVTVTLNGSGVSAQFGEKTVRVTSGQPGGAVPAHNKAGGTGGAGGTASGGNVCNINGAAGGRGENGSNKYAPSNVQGEVSIYGPSGGSGGSLSGHKYYCTAADAPIKAILGKGGVGAGNMESVHEMSDSNGNRHVSFGPTPQPQGGYPGGVIVETAAK